MLYSTLLYIMYTRICSTLEIISCYLYIYIYIHLFTYIHIFTLTYIYIYIYLYRDSKQLYTEINHSESDHPLVNYTKEVHRCEKYSKREK